MRKRLNEAAPPGFVTVGVVTVRQQAGAARRAYHLWRGALCACACSKRCMGPPLLQSRPPADPKPLAALHRKLRYYKRFIPPGGLPQLHLYGVYAATSNDGDKEMYAALLRHCEDADSGSSSMGGSLGSIDRSLSSGSESSLDLELVTAAAAGGMAAAASAAPGAAAGQPAPGSSRQQERVQAALSGAAARLEGLPAEERHALLHSGDIHEAAERLLGMRLFLGGISHSQFHSWAAATGYAINGRPATQL